jgi:hypothetical protein
MSTTSRINNGSTMSAPRKSYITTGAYANDIYSYAVTFNFPNYSGALTPLGAGVVTPNVAGTILRETGRKLYPDANAGISTYMVSVYHPDFGTGFIDPNSPKFAVYNSDKPYYLADGVDPATSLKDEGAPVYTRGTITAEGAISTSSTLYAVGAISTGSSVAATTEVTAGGQIRSTTVSTVSPTTGSITINGALGQVHTLAASGNCNINAAQPNNIPGAVIYVIITNTTIGNITIDFNTGFRTQSAGVQTMGAGTIYTFSFVSDGTNFFQIGAQAAVISQ